MITEAISPLRQRMIEDMSSRKLGTHTQRSHIHSCKRLAEFLKRSPDTATAEDIRLFQLHLAETGMSICNRNRIMTGVRFLFRVTLRRLDLAAEIYHLREPQKIAQVMSPDETRRLLAVASSLKARVALSLSYGGGLRASEVVRLKVKHIDKAQRIIRIEQSKGRKDRNVMLSPKMLDLLRQWWKVRPTRWDTGVPLEERWLFPGRSPSIEAALPWRLKLAQARQRPLDRHGMALAARGCRSFERFRCTVAISRGPNQSSKARGYRGAGKAYPGDETGHRDDHQHISELVQPPGSCAAVPVK